MSPFPFSVNTNCGIFTNTFFVEGHTEKVVGATLFVRNDIYKKNRNICEINILFI